MVTINMMVITQDVLLFHQIDKYYVQMMPLFRLMFHVDSELEIAPTFGSV